VQTAAARIDVAAWFRSLARKKRRIAQTLARGEGTGKVARMFGLTAGRVSQLRRELAESWEEFQGEPVAA
jgi:uroporphyrinogen-III synthase